MKQTNKVTGYEYLQLKYDNELVDKVFKELNLDKEREMPIEGKRASGNTTILICELVLTELSTGCKPTIGRGFDNNTRVKLDHQLNTNTHPANLEVIQNTAESIVNAIKGKTPMLSTMNENKLETFKCTPQLRWVNREKTYTVVTEPGTISINKLDKLVREEVTTSIEKVLQQAWVNNKGTVDWRDVLEEEEE